jgi:putative DNA topoisomerase
MISSLNDITKMTVVKKRSDSRNSVKISKKKVDKIQSEVRQYYDKNGYLSWSEKKRKYVILGTNTPVNGLVECPDCHVGKLLIIRSRKTKKRFIGCSNYYNGCRASAPLVQRGMICATKMPCKICFWPIILLRYSRKQKWARQCSNMRCESRISKS